MAENENSENVVEKNDKFIINAPDKVKAEVDKLAAETEAIRQKMAIEKERHQRDLDLIAANQDKVKAEAASVEMMNLATKINLDREQEKRAIELASDHFHKIYYFDHEVSAETVGRCMTKVKTWCRTAPGGGPIEIEIIFNSPGGDVVNGLALYDFIQSIRSQGHRVITGALGMAASMGSILLQAGDVRYMGKGAVMLIHEVSSVAWGKTSEVEDRLSLIKKFQERAIQIYVERSKGSLTKEKVEEGWKRKDWWLTSQECLDLNLIDEIR